MTSLSFVESTESYAVSLVTINRQTSYDSGILRQDYGIIRGLPMIHLGCTSIGKDRNGRALLPHRTRLCGQFTAAIAGLFLDLTIRA